jgi:hypothetical protein
MIRGRLRQWWIWIALVSDSNVVYRREDLFIDRMDQNQEIFARYMNDRQFQEVVAATLLRHVYKQIRERTQNPQAEQVRG